jgi:DNA-binding transcriptional ArsR family regulator
VGLNISETPGSWELTSRARVLEAVLRVPLSAHILNLMVQYSRHLDAGFAALADATRRGVLERLGRGEASVSELAAKFGMTLTGMKKHIHVLEDAGLVTTHKVGRVRTCRLGPRRLDDEVAWIATYREALEARLDRLGEFVARTKPKHGDHPTER